MDDILNFGCDMLVDNGRLCMWMPTANDDETEIAIPTHPALKLVSVSVQQFNKCRHLVGQRTSQFADTCLGARRLLTYQRIAEAEINQDAMRSRQRRDEAQGTTADELNKFRRKVSCFGITIEQYLQWHSTLEASKSSKQSKAQPREEDFGYHRAYGFDRHPKADKNVTL